MVRQKWSIPVAIMILHTLAVLVVSNNALFWDTIQFAALHPDALLHTGLQTLQLPPDIDSGHPPLFGYYIAICWRTFGRSLFVTHLAMLPFLWIAAAATYLTGVRLFGKRGAAILSLLWLCCPVWASQSLLVSPDIVVMAGFWLTAAAILPHPAERTNHHIIAAIGILLMCSVSMRGMMVTAAFGTFVTIRSLLTDRTVRSLITLWLPFLPGTAFAAGFLWWHHRTVGWTGYHAGSSWSNAFERVDLSGFVRNIALLTWRLADFGMVAIWLCVLGLLWQQRTAIVSFFMARGRTSQACAATACFGASPCLAANAAPSAPYARSRTQSDPSTLLIFVAILAVFLLPSMLLYRGLIAHRYLMPLYAGGILVVVCFILKQTKLSPSTLTGVLMLWLLAGNFWIYPSPISNGWDSTLSHLPYYPLRLQAISWLDSQHIAPENVGSAFPNLRSFAQTDLNGDPRQFSALTPESNQYIMYSNIFNDFEQPQLELLSKWPVVFEAKRGLVEMKIYRNPNN